MLKFLALTIVLAAQWHMVAYAGLEEIEPGTFVDDFEDGSLLDYALSGNTDADVSEGLEGSILDVRGAGRVTLEDMEFKDCSVEITVKGGEGGIQFGGKYQAVLTTYFGGSLRISEDGKGDLALLKRGYRIGRSYRLKVVCFASFIRVYVDGKKEFEKADASPTTGTVALVTGEKGALLDDLRVSKNLSPEDGTMAEPVEEDQTLIFSSEKDATLHLRTANASTQPVRLIAAVRRYKATPVAEEKTSQTSQKPKRKVSNTASPLTLKFGTQFYYNIESLPDKPAAQAEAILKPKSATSLDLNLGKIPPGSYLLDLRVSWKGKERSCRMCALFVFKDIEPSKYESAPIPIGPYTHKVPRALQLEDPLWWNTYVHAMALLIRQHHMNMVVACGAYEPEVIKIFQRYGVAVVERGDAFLDTPGVIGTLLGDEPHKPEMDYYQSQYEAVLKTTDKPVMTTCIGEGMGMGGRHFFWEATQPSIRVFRWYGIKKHFYGIQHPAFYKGMLPFQDVLRIADASFDTPFWVVMPTNGDTSHEAYFQYPTPAQHRGYMHLCVAHGAKGMLLYSLQNQFGVSIVDTVTLEPNGKNLAAIGEVAGYVRSHGELLRSLKVGKFDVRCESPDIEPVPLHDGANGRYVYVVNRNTKENTQCKLFWPVRLGRTKVTDIYENRTRPSEIDASFVSVSLDLVPGDGRLLRLENEK